MSPTKVGGDINTKINVDILKNKKKWPQYDSLRYKVQDSKRVKQPTNITVNNMQCLILVVQYVLKYLEGLVKYFEQTSRSTCPRVVGSFFYVLIYVLSNFLFAISFLVQTE